MGEDPWCSVVLKPHRVRVTVCGGLRTLQGIQRIPQIVCAATDALKSIFGFISGNVDSVQQLFNLLS